jgi:hypothetical protein
MEVCVNVSRKPFFLDMDIADLSHFFLLEVVGCADRSNEASAMTAQSSWVNYNS